MKAGAFGSWYDWYFFSFIGLVGKIAPQRSSFSYILCCALALNLPFSSIKRLDVKCN